MQVKRWVVLPLLALTVGAAEAEDKVTICHRPPGNPDNERTISVGESAVAAHVAEHGDSVGSCSTTSSPPTPSGGGSVLVLCNIRGGGTGHQLTVSPVGRVSHIRISCD